jgi:asparagine synthase (glutamine-hydrolysing)
MCGIFGLLNDVSPYNDHITSSQRTQAFNAGMNRGPEEHRLLENINRSGVSMYFHRLSINGLNSLSGQPLRIGDVTLICNGEIYNYKQLFRMLNKYGVKQTTNSDCEVIIHLYNIFGIERTLEMLDGVFSFMLLEQQVGDLCIPDKVYVARDPFGVRPLYVLMDKNNQDKLYGFASELKVLKYLMTDDYITQPFEPGTYSVFEKKFMMRSNWKKAVVNRPYFTLMTSPSVLIDMFYGPPKSGVDTYGIYDVKHQIDMYSRQIYEHLCEAVRKRVEGTTDRPVACLLSGGLDSSLIASLVSKYYKGVLETYSIGMQGSEDLRYARIVANHIKSKHTEIILTKEEFFDVIPEVIEKIESYDTTTVRASVGNYLIGKYIAKHSDAKVIFNGDGSDELTGGYLYFLACPNSLEFDNECRRLLKNIHRFDVLRSDMSISSNGLEPRTPFLDRTFVSYYLSLPADLRNPRSEFNVSSDLWDIEIGKKRRPEKLLLRYAMSSVEPTLLPKEIMWRTKEAFSDGVSGVEGSWYQIIKEKVGEIYKEKMVDLSTKTLEQHYYRDEFDKLYPNMSNNIPYYWMPNYVKATDASARTLEIYNEEDK